MPKANLFIAFEFYHNSFYFYYEKENFDAHAQYHPELLDPTFKNRIKRAIKEPHYVYPSFHPKGRFCCYYKEFEVEGKYRYTKVVLLQKSSNSYEIITAFRPTNIREKSYNKALDLKDLKWI